MLAQWVNREDATFDLNDLNRVDRWNYYTSSYVRIEPTEGIPRGKMHKSVLRRNVRTTEEAESEDNAHRKPLVYSEDLTLRICVNSFKIVYAYPGSEYFIYTDKPMTGSEVPIIHSDATDEQGNSENSEGEMTEKIPAVSAARERLRKAENMRSEKFRDKFVRNNNWMKNISREQVEKVNNDFKKWMDEGVLPGNSDAASGDVEMAQ